MSIKTDAIIAHNGADGYTLHVDYDPDTDAFNLKAIFNDGTVKELNGNIDDELLSDSIIDRSITSISSNVLTVGFAAFRNCPDLVSADFPEATSLAGFALAGCTALTTVNIPKVTSIAGNVLYGSNVLTEIYLSKDMQSIANEAFTATKNGLIINCGFSSDSPLAATAPWGAPNGVVNYDVPEPQPLSSLSMAPDPGLIQNIDLEPVEDIQPVEEPVLEVKKTTRKAAK